MSDYQGATSSNIKATCYNALLPVTYQPIHEILHCNDKSHHPVIPFENPVSIPIVPINNEIKSNTSLGFVHNVTQLNVYFSYPIKIYCSVNICDIQIVNDWLNTKGCGFYGMSTNSTILVIPHSISVETVQCVRFQMD